MPRLTDRFIQPGDVLDVTAPYAVTPGDGMIVGTMFGISADISANGAPARMLTGGGVFDIAKTAAQVGTAGALAYWDNTARSITTVSAANFRVGFFTQAAAGGDALCRVRLSGTPSPAGAV